MGMQRFVASADEKLRTATVNKSNSLLYLISAFSAIRQCQHPLPWYIWVLSFGEFWLAMSARLPMVGPLLCSAWAGNRPPKTVSSFVTGTIFKNRSLSRAHRLHPALLLSGYRDVKDNLVAISEGKMEIDEAKGKTLEELSKVHFVLYTFSRSLRCTIAEDVEP